LRAATSRIAARCDGNFSNGKFGLIPVANADGLTIGELP
jgi:hypothetical protein